MKLYQFKKFDYTYLSVGDNPGPTIQGFIESGELIFIGDCELEEGLYCYER